ncbi:MAG: hypothetical protein HY554_01475, partial [Elusimicrobia bacterium]|nr:hypothetical protein [Elusimicrobiota bacterium]
MLTANRRAALALLAASLAAGCSPRTAALRAMVPMLDRASEAFHDEADPQLAREAFASQLKLLEGLLRNDPANPTLRRLLAEGFGGYAFLFLEESEPERAKGAYLRGRDYALGALPGPLATLAQTPLEPLRRALAQAR